MGFRVWLLWKGEAWILSCKINAQVLDLMMNRTPRKRVRHESWKESLIWLIQYTTGN